MLRPLLIEDNVYNHQGSNHYLHYRLNLAHIAWHHGKVLKNDTMAFFSLKDAFCALLTTDISMVDDHIAEAKQKDYAIRMEITNSRNRLVYGHLTHNSPNHRIGPHDPGIYLKSDLDTDSLRQLTGIPFPRNSQLDQPGLVPLLDYTRDFTDTTPNAFYEAMWSYAMAYQQMRELVTRQMDYQLVLKGEIAGPVKKGERQDQYVAVHHFEQAHQPLRHLLGQNLERLDPNSAVAVDRSLDVGYIVQEGKNIIASFKVISMADAPDGQPCAGIYLHADNDVSELESLTGVDLDAAGTYDPGMPMVLLAKFAYNDGFQLQPDPTIQQVIAQYDRDFNDNPAARTGIYQTFRQYTFADNAAGLQPFRQADSYYHHHLLPAALLNLLLTELAYLAPDHATIDPIFQITRAGVVTTSGDLLAYLHRGHASDPTLQADSIYLVLDRLHPAVPVALSRAIEDAELALLHHPDKGVLIVPVGHRSTEGLVPYTETLLTLTGLLTERYHQDLKAETTRQQQGATAATVPPYMIQLEWQPPSGTQASNTAHLAQQHLEDAHHYLLQMDTKLFIDHHPQRQIPFLAKASLVDAANGQTIMARFYQQHASEDLQAGIYIQYNLDHPDALRLTHHQPHLRFLEHASTDHHHLYQQRLPPDDTTPLGRTRMGEDRGSDRGRHPS